MLFLKAMSYWTELVNIWMENGMMTEDKKNSILKALNDRNTRQSVCIHRVGQVASKIAEIKLRRLEKVMEKLSIRLKGWVEEMTAFLDMEERAKWINDAFSKGMYPVRDHSWEEDLQFDIDNKNY